MDREPRRAGHAFQPFERALDARAMDRRAARRARRASPRASPAAPRPRSGPWRAARRAGRRPRGGRSRRAGGPRPHRSLEVRRLRVQDAVQLAAEGPDDLAGLELEQARPRADAPKDGRDRLGALPGHDAAAAAEPPAGARPMAARLAASAGASSGRPRTRDASAHRPRSASPARGTGRGATPCGSARDAPPSRTARGDLRGRLARASRTASRASAGSRLPTRRVEARELGGQVAGPRRVDGRELGPQREHEVAIGAGHVRPDAAPIRSRRDGGSLALPGAQDRRGEALRIVMMRRSGSTTASVARAGTGSTAGGQRGARHRAATSARPPGRPRRVEPVVGQDDVHEAGPVWAIERLDVVGQVEARRLAGLRRDVADVHAEARGRHDGVADLRDRSTGRRLVKRLPGPRTMMSASAIAASASSDARHVGRRDPDPLDARRPHDVDWPETITPFRVRAWSVIGVGDTGRTCRGPRGPGSCDGRPPRSRRPRPPSARRSGGCRSRGHRARPARSRPARPRCGVPPGNR